MKKVLIGCGVGCLVIVIVAVGAGIWFTMKAKQMFQPAIDVMADYDRTNRDYAFTEPAGDALDAARFAEYVNVRQDLMAEAVAKLQAVQEKAAGMMDEQNASLGGIMTAMKDILDAFVSTGEKHIALLDEHKMSRNEYDYITQVMHATIDKGADQNPACAELNAIVDELMSQQGGPEGEDFLSALPTQGIDYVSSNGDLIAQHKDTLANPKESFKADYVLAWINNRAQEQAQGMQGKVEE